MYDFAIVALLALATVKVADFLCDNLTVLENFRSLVIFVLAVGSIVWLDYSVFAEWGADVRNETLGVWMTGFLVAGLTVAWRAVFGFLTQYRATGDESLGEHTSQWRCGPSWATVAASPARTRPSATPAWT